MSPMSPDLQPQRQALPAQVTESYWITTRRSKRNVKLHKKRNEFVMRMAIMPPHDAVRSNEGKKDNERVLGQFDCTRQED